MMLSVASTEARISDSLQNTADFFLKKNNSEFGDLISNLKLQKLVYYAQGFHLSLYNSPLFDEDIVAWEHGPVVENLYFKYNTFGSSPIPEPDYIKLSNFQNHQIELLDEVFQVYGQFSARKLRNMTHSERPWLETPKNQIIKKDLMRDFFKTLLK